MFAFLSCQNCFHLFFPVFAFLRTLFSLVALDSSILLFIFFSKGRSLLHAFSLVFFFSVARIFLLDTKSKKKKCHQQLQKGETRQ